MNPNEELETLAAKLLQSGVCRTSMEAKSMAQGMIQGTKSSPPSTHSNKPLRELTKESSANEFLDHVDQTAKSIAPQTVSGYESAIERLTAQIQALQQSVQTLSMRVSRLEEKPNRDSPKFVFDDNLK